MHCLFRSDAANSRKSFAGMKISLWLRAAATFKTKQNFTVIPLTAHGLPCQSIGQVRSWEESLMLFLFGGGPRAVPAQLPTRLELPDILFLAVLMMTSSQIRQSFLDFFKSKRHT